MLTVRPDAPSVRVEASAPAEARTRHDGGVFGELEDGVGLWSRRPGRGLLLGRQDAKRGREAGPSITRRRIMVELIPSPIQTWIAKAFIIANSSICGNVGKLAGAPK